MVHDFLFAAFADPARRQQYEQLRAALRDEPNGPVTLLLANFALEEGGVALDALLVRPHGITLLDLLPQGGELTAPAPELGAWKIDGQSLAPGPAEANPMVRFQTRKTALIAWLGAQFGPDQADLSFISGLLVFAGPVTCGPDLAAWLARQPPGGLHLLDDAARLPQKINQLTSPHINLSADALTEWAHDLAPETGSAAEEAGFMESAPAPASSWARLRSWLGADDIPADPPYGYPAQQMAANSAEIQRLEQERNAAQLVLRQQLLALEARETEREHSIGQLREQLAQAAPVTSEAERLREELAAENREKTAVADAIRAYRAESETRNQALDGRIAQLSQLLEQLQVRADAVPVPVVAPAATPAAATRRVAESRPRPGISLRRPPAPAARPRQLGWKRQAPLLAAALGLVGLLGAGGWLLTHRSAGPAASQPAAASQSADNGTDTSMGAEANFGEMQPAAPAAAPPAGTVTKENGVYGLRDAAGNEVIAPAYDELRPPADGYARVRVDAAYTFVDAQGRELDTYYADARDFAEGYAAVLDDRGWHYINGPEEPGAAGSVFAEAYSFREGLARVRLSDGYTFISRDYLRNPDAGTAPFGRYESATDFEQGQALVTQNGRRFRIDRNGETVE